MNTGLVQRTIKNKEQVRLQVQRTFRLHNNKLAKGLNAQLSCYVKNIEAIFSAAGRPDLMVLTSAHCLKSEKEK